MAIEKAEEFVGGGELEQLEEEVKKLGNEAAELEERGRKERQMGLMEKAKITKFQRESKLNEQREKLRRIHHIKGFSLEEE